MVSQKYSHPNPKSDRQEELKLGGEEREEGDGKEGKKGGFAKEDYSSFTWLKVFISFLRVFIIGI